MVLLGLLLTGVVRADPMNAPVRTVRRINRWWWLVPGAGQYSLGQNGLAAFYLGGTLGLLGWGTYEGIYPRRGNETNSPLVYAQQLYLISLYAAYRDARLDAGSDSRIPVDPSSTTQLVTAPFRSAQLLSPWVIGAAVVGAGAVLASTLTDSSRPFRQMSRFHYLGSNVNRDQSIPVFSAYWIPLSLGAGVSEEEFFRGILQSQFEDHWGRTPGWLAASGLFGLAHFANNWQISDVFIPALGGLYLGWRYQKTNYHLSQSIAAHVWYDLAVGMTEFFMDPKNNPLGASVDFVF